MIPEISTDNPNAGLFSGASQVLGKDDFLKLLITQLRHQDPLNPMKSEEFAAQLAQFSSLEQLQNINQSLGDSLQSDLLLSQSINNMLATTLIGKRVKALGNTLVLRESPSPELHFRLDAPAAQVTLEIRNAQGQVVRTVELDARAAGDHTYEWNGRDDAGNALPEGPYQFSVSAADSEGSSIGVQTFVVGIIREVRYENGNAILHVGDQDINMADVFEVGQSEEEEGRD